MWRIAAASLAFTMLALQLKQVKQEYSFYLILGAGVFFGYCVLEKISYFIKSIYQLQEYAGFDNVYIESIVKMIGITCLGEFSADFCRDCGYESIGRQVSMAARLTILSFSMPIVLAIMKSVWKLT